MKAINSREIKFAVFDNEIWPCIIRGETRHFDSGEETYNLSLLNPDGSLQRNITLPVDRVIDTIGDAVSMLRIRLEKAIESIGGSAF